MSPTPDTVPHPGPDPDFDHAVRPLPLNGLTIVLPCFNEPRVRAGAALGIAAARLPWVLLIDGPPRPLGV
jgi:hypothetical protein